MTLDSSTSVNLAEVHRLAAVVKVNKAICIDLERGIEAAKTSWLNRDLV